MELIAAEDLKEIHVIFVNKFEGQHSWIHKKQESHEVIVHITKKVKSGLGEDGFSVVNAFDLRPFPPTEHHEIFYIGFADIRPGEAFEFINDHDPLPLYIKWKQKAKIHLNGIHNKRT